MTIDYELVSKESRRLKGNLTRARNSGDPCKVIAVCRDAQDVFAHFGYPDAWAVYQTAYDDAAQEILRSNPFYN